MKQQDTVTSPFVNNGLVIRKDQSVLSPGEYYEFLNMQSIQEGALTVRFGNADVAPALANSLWLDAGGNRLHTITKLRLSANETANPRYIGFGRLIYRTTPNSGGEYSAATSIALDGAEVVGNPPVPNPQPYLPQNERWSHAIYNTGAQGQSSLYVASTVALARHDGGTGVLQAWGVPVPTRPAIAGPGVATLVPILTPNTTEVRVRIQITASFAISVIGTAGYYRYTYNTLSGQPPGQGMVLTDGASVIEVAAIDPASNSFFAYTPTAISGIWYDQAGTKYASVDGVIQQTVAFFAAKDLSLGGLQADQFATRDPIAITIWIDNSTVIQDIRIRLGVGETVDPANDPTDFYEAVVTQSTIASLVSTATDPASQTTVYDVAQDRADLVSSGIVGDYFNENDLILNQIRPQELASTPTAQPQFSQVNPTKLEFVKAGRAGQPGFDWRSITSITLVARSLNQSTGVAYNIALGNVVAVGGGRPDSVQPGYLPYDYIYRYRNPITNAKGNPCVAIPDPLDNGLRLRRRQAIVQVAPVEIAIVGGPQNGNLVGPGSLQLFRSGGSYSDGLYRLVKSHFNPLRVSCSISGGVLTKTSLANISFESYLVGASVIAGGQFATVTSVLSPTQLQLSSAITFTGVADIGTIVTDNAADEDILGAEIMQFDNDQPVTSSLNTAVTGTIGSFSFGTGAVGINRFVVGSQQGDAGRVRLRSLITIGTGDRLEQARIIFVYNTNPLDVEVYFQRSHAVGEPIEINAVTAQPCQLVASVGDSMIIAGDPNNPGALYKSKRGQPEAFPVVDEQTRQVNILQASPPGDPIVDITEWNGEIAVMTVNTIRPVRIWNGVMQPAQESPVNRGPVDRRCWTKGDNRIWYLATDGIYSWGGGGNQKVSEAVDWIFRRVSVNGIPPLDYNNLIFASMGYGNNTLFFSYLATNGLFYRLRYETIYNRWALDITNSTAGNTDVVSTYFFDQDQGLLYASRLNTDAPARYQFIQDMRTGTVGSSDSFPITDATGLNGNDIKFSFTTPAFTAGNPQQQKLFTQVNLELANPDTDVAIVAYYDFSSAPSTDAFVIPAQNGQGSAAGTTFTRSSGITFTADMAGSAILFGDGTFNVITAFVNANVVTLQTAKTFTGDFYLLRRRRVPLPLNQSGSPTQARGREAYAISYQISGEGKIAPTFYSLSFDYGQLADIQRGKGVDWDDLGYPYDKRLDTISIEYNMNGQDVLMYLDTITGVEGETITESAMSFTLGGTGTARAKANLPVVSNLTDRLIAKMIRLRPAVQASNIQIFDYNVSYEKYPQDITRFTEPSDYGQPYEKYFNQLVLEVDTLNIAAQVFVFIDNSGTPAANLTVQSTNVDRIRLLTLPNGIRGRMARLAVIPGVGGKFQLFKHDFVTTPADKGPVTHTYDFSDLGHPFDKRMFHMTFEYEVNTALQVQLSGVSGIGNNQVTTNITLFDLTPGGRKEVTYQFPINSIFKLVRLQPTLTSPTTDAKIYQPSWQFEKYPPDIVPFTEQSNWGTPFQKYFQQILLDVDTGGVEATVQVEVDGTVVQSIPVTTTQQNRIATLTLQGNIIGRQARLINNPGVGGKFQLFSHEFVVLPADKGPVLHTYDWQDNGHPYDKRFYEVSFEYEVQSDMNLVLEGVQGFGNGQTTVTIATLPLAAFGAVRKRVNYAFPDNSVYKLVRLRPESGVPPTGAKIYQPTFQAENYPADIVPFTEVQDYGTPYDKYFQQLSLDVDTGNVQATVNVEIDGTVVQALQVTTTQYNRNRQFTLLPSLVGKKARITATAGFGGKFQLFNHTFIVLPADKGPVLHTFDWDDLGHPFDKRLKTVTLEYDPNGASPVTMLMDTLTGVNGTIQTLAALSFVLEGGQRSLQTFAIPDQTIVKMIRFRPENTSVQFKHWRYVFDFERMPQDTQLFTEYDDLGYPCEKILRSLTLDVDTNAVDAQVDLDVDGSIPFTFNVNTTSTDRTRVITPPSDIIGFRFRLKPRPGPGGKFQLFRYQYDRILEPCRVSRWDSYEQSFGSNGYKFIKQVWLEYTSFGSLRFEIYRDDGELFHVEQLPQQDTRDVYRFYVPKESEDGKYNKSKIYRMVMIANDESGWFKFYRDASRVETMNTGQDQRAGYQQHYLFSQMPIPV